MIIIYIQYIHNYINIKYIIFISNMTIESTFCVN